MSKRHWAKGTKVYLGIANQLPGDQKQIFFLALGTQLLHKV